MPRKNNRRNRARDPGGASGSHEGPMSAPDTPDVLGMEGVELHAHGERVDEALAGHDPTDDEGPS
eukprot:5879636-Pyramimonas_sp.AAC.1